MIRENKAEHGSQSQEATVAQAHNRSKDKAGKGLGGTQVSTPWANVSFKGRQALPHLNLIRSYLLWYAVSRQRARKSTAALVTVTSKNASEMRG